MALLRVAVTNGEGHTHAYRLGAITDHVDILTGVTTPAAEVADKLEEQAILEFPTSTVETQELANNGDGTSTWKPAGEQ